MFRFQSFFTFDLSGSEKGLQSLASKTHVPSLLHAQGVAVAEISTSQPSHGLHIHDVIVADPLEVIPPHFSQILYISSSFNIKTNLYYKTLHIFSDRNPQYRKDEFQVFLVVNMS